MGINRKKRILIVDDSIVFREVLSKSISADPELEVVAKATDPFDARDKILKYEPDVMTCDVEMPKMNGIEFIKRLLPQYALPIIIVSSVNDVVFDALNAGAVDFVAKPSVKDAKAIEKFVRELKTKIKAAANAKVRVKKSPFESDLRHDGELNTKKIIAMGASTGGTEALYNLLKCLPSQMPGILIVQHIPPVFSRMFADRLNIQTRLNVKEAENGDYVEPGRVLIAPGDQHMRVKRVGRSYKVEVFKGEKVSGHCPSVDILFESVASEVKNDSVGVLLTGMGSDGAKGLLSMRKMGAKTIGQDEHSSVVYGMPKVAYEIGAVERQLPLEKIPQYLYSLIR